MWFSVSLHFCLRGREIQCQLRKEDFIFKKDENGDDYIVLSRDFLSKNHQGGLTGTGHTSAGCITDPTQVSAVRRYLSVLHPACDRLFQRAMLTARAGSTWYMNMALSHNLLGKMMFEISAAANLSRTYTNHCVRATAICRLKSCNIEDRRICAVSGHKNVSSLQSYDRVSNAEAVAMAKALDSGKFENPASACSVASSDSVAVKHEPDGALSTSFASSVCASSVCEAEEECSDGDEPPKAHGFVLKNCTNVTMNDTNTWHRPRTFPFSLKLKKKHKHTD